jgi:hypothetical protein
MDARPSKPICAKQGSVLLGKQWRATESGKTSSRGRLYPAGPKHGTGEEANVPFHVETDINLADLSWTRNAKTERHAEIGIRSQWPP